jgi:hypothetical protein
VPAFVRVFDLVPRGIVNHLFDFTATGRTFVQPAFGTLRRTGLAALSAKSDFPAFTAQDDIPPAVHRRAAAKNRPFMQAADGASRDSVLAALLAALHFATQAAQGHFGVGIVRVGCPDDFCFAATQQGEHEHCPRR